jgi:hypothetical protein
MLLENVLVVTIEGALGFQYAPGAL